MRDEMQRVGLVLGLTGAAFLVVSLILRAVSRFHLPLAALAPIDSALFLVPGAVGAVACVTALLLLALTRGHRSASARAADGAPSLMPLNPFPATAKAASENTAL
ncbi:hypothetical protein [Rathayibacter sp. AY1D3]|uniref:hypothetical protein n=1 Tax=Rathayibacter sp. AY1D3 TaxID=2080544 RepID=UPI000CE82377|nr:hypothetical protein [Rathayibacter sp. AY1D3]PPH85285.1 hypothetical protein C5C64_16645 [Rathayibacter sp. AY1D3]